VTVGRGLQEWLKTQAAGAVGEATTLDTNQPEPGAAVDPTPLSDRYDYVREIGSGGVGSVHCVRDRMLLRQAALKILDPVLAKNPVQVERFVNEAQINAQLEHPNIAPVHEIVLSPEGPKYFTMKLVEGENLHDLIVRAGRPGGSPEVLHEMLATFLKVCDALAFAHSRGVIHCDLKPGNIMVGAYGEVYLMDWGLARLRPDATAGIAVSSTDAASGPRSRVLGTPGFMAPEQAHGREADYTERTDVFGLGGVLFAILTGRSPFSGSDVTEALARARACQITFPPASPLQMPPRLCRIAARAMEREPARRYASILELKADVESFLRGGFTFPTRAYPPDTIIVDEGASGDEAFVIEKGTCVVYKTVNGERKVLRHLQAGSVFGETAALAGGTRTATVAAVDKVVVRVVTRQLLEENLGLDSWFGAFVVALADRFREVDEQLAHRLPGE
jgi:eukaryotic-like serine/threonine-protein kinase